MATLQALHFDNATIRELPLDKIVDDKRTRPVPGACYSRVPPTPLENPVTVAVSDSALELLDLDPSEVRIPACYLASLLVRRRRYNLGLFMHGSVHGCMHSCT